MGCPVNHENVPNYSEHRNYKVKPYFKVKDSRILENEEELKKYYGDVTKKVNTERITLVVEDSDKSVSFKCYVNSTGRGVGKRHFGRQNRLMYITFNKKYKNFYSGEKVRKGYKKNILNKIRTNDFIGMNGIISSIPHLIREIEVESDINYNTSGSYKVIEDSLQIFFKRVYGTDSLNFDMYKFKNLIYKTYFDLNGYKLPDEYGKFIDIPIPKSVLRKENNLVNAFMTMYELKGSKVRRLLNSEARVKLNDLYRLYNLLGLDYFNQIRDDFFTQKNEGLYGYESTMYSTYMDLNYPDLLKSEKKKLVKVINSVDISSTHMLSLVDDHLRFKKKLTDYGEDVKIKAESYKEFSREHEEWSTLIDSYRKGNIVREYSVDMEKEIQEVIIGPHIDYYPVLLCTTDEYVEESQHQKNCVRTYTEHANCFIVSIREGGKNGKERATIEYRYSYGEGIKRHQSLGRHNARLSSNWNYVLESLDERVNRLSDSNVIVLPKIKKTFPNGHTIGSEARWVDDENKYPNQNRRKLLKWGDDYSISDGDLFFDNFILDDF